MSFIKQLLLIFLFLGCSQLECVIKKQCTIMIDPAGDAQYAGRAIDDYFERSITLQCAEELKNNLESRYPQIRVILTRCPGEFIEFLQNANFANRLKVDYYISLHFYQEQHEKRRIFIYHYRSHPITDYWKKFSDEDINFIPYYQAHLINSLSTKGCAQLLTHAFQKTDYKKLFEARGPYAFPCKPLMGILAPALCIEAGLSSKNDWRLYVEPLVFALEQIFQQKITHEI